MKLSNALFVCILCIGIFGCNRLHDGKSGPEIQTSNVPANLLQQAKLYYEKETTLSNGIYSDLRLNRSKRKKIIKPIWSTAKVNTLINGAKLVVLDVPEFKFTNTGYRIIRKLVFLLSGDKVMYGRIVEFLGTKTNLARQPDDLITKFNDLAIANFEGSIITYDLQYRYLRGRAFKNGRHSGSSVALTYKPKYLNPTNVVSSGSNSSTSKISFKMSPSELARYKSQQTEINNKRLVSSSEGAPRLSSAMLMSEGDCWDHYMVTYYSDGSQNWQYMYSWCNGTAPQNDGTSPLPGGTPPPSNQTPANYGAPANPANGQVWVYTYPSGLPVEFTWDSQLQAWLLPELQVFKDLGYTIKLPANAPPSFNGQLLTTIGLVAVAEPTFVGEIIWAGAAVVVTSIYLYDMISYFHETRTREHYEYCVWSYVGCTEQTSASDCSTCLQFCIVQGYWDSNNCPGVRPVRDDPEY